MHSVGGINCDPFPKIPEQAKDDSDASESALVGQSRNHSHDLSIMGCTAVQMVNPCN